ncbi:peptidoglycan-binding domain-containing protein [Luteibacter sp. 22Crub2.1]|uniref:peptidoglycan-binding domain-containing protein n=1 Tax=Luteibacter sp. 22Crub2.1 TaxID=1283288 RepID=UPI0009A63E0F|nr:peptidoglycan-binding domain-containing protein [Luteibacter sp. 22Crub2.1]SKB69530.1 Uncharacterized protein conserved in bacteria [Luteibacter sp. 22Crub2.1]
MTDMTTDQLRTMLFSTENSNNQAALNTFSYAGGNKSSYSFGMLQFDVRTDHGGVQDFLRENGFSQQQIQMLSQHGGLSEQELSGLNAQLKAIPQDKIDTFTNSQLDAATGRVSDVVDRIQNNNPVVGHAIAASPELQLALADYDNQFTISGIDSAATPNNSMLAYLEGKKVTLPGGTLQLQGDHVSREDIQKFINATKYGVDHPTSVANREMRLEKALHGMSLAQAQGQPTQNAPASPAADGPTASTPAAPNPTAPTAASQTLREGLHDDDRVRVMQATLVELGYKDSHGRTLEADGNFGPATRHAVEAFQRDHGLTADGAAGKNTLRELRDANAHRDVPPPSLENADHAGNGMYRQALFAVQRFDAEQGRTSDQYTSNFAGSLAAKGKAEGLERIDQVVLSDNRDRAWAVQGDMNSPFKRYAEVDTVQAVNTPLAQSTQAWEQSSAQQGQMQQTAPTQQLVESQPNRQPGM